MCLFCSFVYRFLQQSLKLFLFWCCPLHQQQLLQQVYCCCCYCCCWGITFACCYYCNKSQNWNLCCISKRNKFSGILRNFLRNLPKFCLIFMKSEKKGKLLSFGLSLAFVFCPFFWHYEMTGNWIFVRFSRDNLFLIEYFQESSMMSLENCNLFRNLF